MESFLARGSYSRLRRSTLGSFRVKSEGGANSEPGSSLRLILTKPYLPTSVGGIREGGVDYSARRIASGLCVRAS